MDQQEFKKIFDIYFPKLAYYLHRTVKNKDLAHDIASDCFLKLLESKVNFKNEKEIQHFLFVQARNAVITHLTRNKQVGEYSQIESYTPQLNEGITVNEKKSSEVIIYIPEKPSLFDQENIVNACGEFMEALGYEMKTEDEPVYNSFWQKIKFIFKRNITEEDVNNLFDKGKKALELKYVELPTAEQTEKLANATEKILNSIAKFDNCTIRLGSLLIVKRMVGTESVLKIHQLSLEEIKYLEESNSIIKDREPLTTLFNLTRDEHDKKKYMEEVAAHILSELNAFCDNPPLAAEDEVKDSEPLSGSLPDTSKKENTIK
jgi:DNA-directed RNA polymerase specialized sigma24 family protein